MSKASASISSKLSKLRDSIRVHGGRMSRDELVQIRTDLRRLSEYVDLVDALHDDPWERDEPDTADVGDDPFSAADRPMADAG